MSKCIDCKNFEVLCSHFQYCNGWKRPKRIVPGDELIDAPCDKYNRKEKDITGEADD